MTKQSGRGDSAREAALTALYAELPRIECRGQCWDSCGRLPVLPAVERRRLAAAGASVAEAGQFGELAGPGLCPSLNLFNACSVYEIRPLICRLWGLPENLPCTFGCVPEGGHLTVAEGYEFLARAYEISGDHVRAAWIREPFSTPAKAAAMTALVMRQREEDHDAYAAYERRAVATGTAVYPAGRGRLVPKTNRDEAAQLREAD